MIRPALAALAALLVAACGQESPPAAEAARPTPVRVAPVEEQALVAPVRAVGFVAPRDEVRLAFKAGGVVGAIAVEEGDRVRAGQLLAQLEQAEVGAAVDQAREAASKAERDLARAEQLFADEVATREQLDDARTAVAVARAQLRAASFTAQYARIVAPADGVVLRRLAEPRELVAGGQPVLVLGGTQRGWIVKAGLSDRDVVRVAVGDAAVATLDAFPGRRLPARVVEIASAADPLTGTFTVEFALEPGELRLAQGLVAKVVLEDARAATVPVVPVSAVLEADAGRASVFVVDGGSRKARRVAVRTGRLVGDRVEIVEGLAAGQQVVTEGAEYLRDGAAVDVLVAG